MQSLAVLYLLALCVPTDAGCGAEPLPSLSLGAFPDGLGSVFIPTARAQCTPRAIREPGASQNHPSPSSWPQTHPAGGELSPQQAFRGRASWGAAELGSVVSSGRCPEPWGHLCHGGTVLPARQATDNCVVTSAVPPEQKHGVMDEAPAFLSAFRVAQGDCRSTSH